MKHQGSLILNTARLRLRPYLPGDAQAMFDNWCADPEVTRFLTWEPHPDVGFTQGLLDQWVQSYCSETVYHWGITLKGELIGDIAVVTWSDSNRSCEIGYCLSRRFWGRGVMTEALTSVLRYLFDSVGFHRVCIRHDADNPASGRVMQKAGLLYEGRLRQALRRRDGSYGDICVYGALRDEWHEAQRKGEAG